VSVPRSEQAADVDDLAEVMRIVVGEQHGFAENGLSIGPGQFGEEIGFRICDQILHGFQIGLELGDAFRPRVLIGRGFVFRPVVVGPLQGCVVLGAAEFEDIPLCDAEVFEEHPGRVRVVGGLFATKIRREIFDDVFEFGVGVASDKEFEEMLAQGALRIFELGGGLGRGLFGHGVPFLQTPRLDCADATEDAEKFRRCDRVRKSRFQFDALRLLARSKLLPLFRAGSE
jgi:hypothetical protein